MPVVTVRPRRLVGEKERNAVLNFINTHGSCELPQISSFIVNSLGFSQREALARTKEIAGMLERQELIKGTRQSSQLVLVTITDTGKRSLMPPTRTIKVIKKSKPVELSVEPTTLKEDGATDLVQAQAIKSQPRRKKRILKQKGLARERRRNWLKGERNENRFFALAKRLVDILKSEFREVVLDGQCIQSGHTNRRKKIIDRQDSAGEDVVIKLETKSELGHPRPHRVIYDAKSSQHYADIFNQSIRLKVGQRSAALKKAIVCSDVRSDTEIVGEMLGDMIGAAVLPSSLNRDLIFSHF